MKWILFGLLLLLLLLVIIIMTKMKIIINYKHYQDDDSLKIEFRALFGLIKYKLDVPLIKVDDNSPAIVVDSTLESENSQTKKKNKTHISVDEMTKGYQDMKALMEHIVSFHRIIRHFFKRVKIIQLEWYSTIGAGDAALTGMLTGAVWTIKGSMIGLLSHYFLLQSVPHISVQPHFQLKVTQTAFKCMLQFRIGHAMFAGIKFVKFWKGGLPKFKSKPLSALSQDKTNSI